MKKKKRKKELIGWSDISQICFWHLTKEAVSGKWATKAPCNWCGHGVLSLPWWKQEELEVRTGTGAIKAEIKMKGKLEKSNTAVKVTVQNQNPPSVTAESNKSRWWCEAAPSRSIGKRGDKVPLGVFTCFPGTLRWSTTSDGAVPPTLAKMTEGGSPLWSWTAFLLHHGRWLTLWAE